MTITRAVSEIWYAKEERQRKDMGDLTSLINSINQIGIINPVVITREGQLIAGERRLSAAKEIGLPYVPVRYLEDLSPSQLKLVELDENIKRKDIDWKENVLAVKEYTEISRKENPSITGAAIADQLGLDPSQWSRHMGMAEYLEAGHEALCAAPQFSVARGIWERAEARKNAENLDEIDAALGVPPLSSTPVTVEADLANEIIDEQLAPIYVGDFATTSSYRGPKINFLHCDFPYGIGADDHDQGSAKAFGGYEDSAAGYWSLLDTLESFMTQHLAKSVHLMFWFSMLHYEQTRLRLESMGWRVNPVPLVWYKSDNAGILPDPRRSPRQIYEVAFLCSLGDRFLVGAKANTFAHPLGQKTYHMSEKPVAMLNHFFQMFVDETTVMFDPTCGSGNALIAAHRLKAKHVHGLEINPEFAKLAIENWRKHVTEA